MQVAGHDKAAELGAALRTIKGQLHGVQEQYDAERSRGQEAHQYILQLQEDKARLQADMAALCQSSEAHKAELQAHYDLLQTVSAAAQVRCHIS